MPWKSCCCSVIGVPMPYSRLAGLLPDQALHLVLLGRRRLSEPLPLADRVHPDVLLAGHDGRLAAVARPAAWSPRGTAIAVAEANFAPFGAVKIVPFGSVHGRCGSLLTTVMLPPA